MLLIQIFCQTLLTFPDSLLATKAGGILKKQKGKHALCNIDNRERQLFVEWVKASQKLVSNC